MSDIQSIEVYKGSDHNVTILDSHNGKPVLYKPNDKDWPSFIAI